MKYQIDQSGKIEDTAKNTVIAYSNSTQRAVLIPKRLKRQIQETLRQCGIIRLFIYSLFSAGIYHLIKDLKQVSDITIDTEYPGKDKLITAILKLLLKKNSKPQHHIHFARIGNHPKAHYAAKDVFDKKVPPNYILSLTEAIRTLKKTDGRLRECLSTLVDARSRSYKGKVSQKFKKVNRKNLQSGFIKLTKRTLVMLLIFSILLPSIILYSLFIIPKTAEAVWFNDNWAYRKRVDVTVASSTSDTTNLQMLLTIDTSTSGIASGKMQASCQDLRFTNTNGKVLPYYIDSGCTTTTTKIWVMVDLVPKNTTSMTLFMYYGNPSAVAGSNPQPYFDNVVGLVGYWTMNNNISGDSQTISDYSISGNNGTTHYGANSAGMDCTVSGQYSKGCSFDGSDYISVTDAAALAPLTGQQTIEVWANLTDYSGDGYTDLFNNGGTGNHYMTLRWNAPARSSTMTASWRDASGNSLAATSTTTYLANSGWHHIVGVRTSQTTASIYVDGVLVGTGSNSSVGSVDAGGAEPPEIGKISCCGDTLQAFFQGQLDEVKVYNTARSASQILNDYNNKLPNGQTLTIASTAPTTVVPTSPTYNTEEKAPSPIAYWKFNDGQGTNAQDSTTNNNDATITGATWQTEDMCVSGKCLYFDGTTDYVTVTDNNSLDFAATDSFSISFWLRTGDTGSITNLFTKYPGSNIYYTVELRNSGKTYFEIYDNTNVSNVSSTAAVNDNKWHFISAVRSVSADKLYVYVDGVEQASATDTTTGTLANSGNLTIGDLPSIASRELTGFIDEPKIYPYARSAAQILADYNSRGNNEGSSSSTAGGVIASGAKQSSLSDGLVGYWKMDEASANSCTGSVNDNCDSSGNGNDGAWNGDATSAAGKFGNGTTFDGTGDNVSVADNTALQILSGGITLSALVNPSSVSQVYGPIVVKGNSNDAGNYRLELNNQKVSFRFWSGSGSNSIYQTSSDLVSTSGQWYHIVLSHTWGNASSTKLYINGVQASSSWTQGTGNETPVAGGNVLIGRELEGGGISFNGTVDETRIYNRAISPNEVSALYNFAPGPKVYLKMDEGSGTSANDSSGNSNNATVNTGTWTTGKYGKGVGVSGSTGSDVSVPDFSY